MSPIPRCDLRLPTMDCKKERVVRSVDANSLKVVSKHSSMPKDVKRTSGVKKVTKRARQAEEGSSNDATVASPADAPATTAPVTDVITVEPSTEATSTEATSTEATSTEGTSTEATSTETTTAEAVSTETTTTEKAVSDDTTTAPAEETTGSTTAEAGKTVKPTRRTAVGCLEKKPTSDDLGEDKEDPECRKKKATVPPEMEQQDSRVNAPRDSLETTEIKEKIASGELPRDTADSIRQSKRMQEIAFGEIENPICTTGEEDALVEKTAWASCPGTPGDTTYDWLAFERPESPDAKIPQPQKVVDMANMTTTQLEELMCKRRHKRLKYIKMWGSEEAVRRFTKRKLEARRKRKQLEKMHAQNSWLREKMRNHARKKRRMYRCKDQSKIPSLNEDIQINKAFYFRFNYNNHVPCMPSDMDKHFSQYKKPPFKNKALRRCVKAVDEFETLRVQRKQSR